MKKIAIIAFLLAVSVAAGRAQESRQDVSISGSALIEPYRVGTANVQVSANRNFGFLASYRFMFTPSSAIEANYGFSTGNIIHYDISASTANINVHTRNHEISGAYVRSFNYRKFNPFVEAGGGAMLFVPIRDEQTQSLDVKQQARMGFLYGGGVAYEISPSFDIRAEYRGFVTKVPTFGMNGSVGYNFTTNKWYNIYIPTVGVAYHF